MDIIWANPTQLKDYENNARTHSKEQIDQIINSIKEFGFNVPVEVNSDFIILSGHARVQAAKKMELEKIPIVVHSHLIEDVKQREYILAANKIAMNAGWDLGILSNELNFLNDENSDLQIMGFSQKEIDEMLSVVDLNLEKLNPENESFSSIFEVIVELSDESSQRELYEELTQRGLKCRVLSM